MADKLRYAYYPGCASQEITKEANVTTRLVARKLGIELHDMPKASCCGAGLLTDYDYQLYIAINARIFAEAEQMGMDIMTICSTCLMVMRTANYNLKTSPELLAKTNEILATVGLHYRGTVEVKQLLWVLAGEYGLNNLKKKVVKPLDWMKIAPFYGCHSLRPSNALGFDDPEMPQSLDKVIEALGAQPVDYSGKTKCCGFQVDLVAVETAEVMTATRLLDGKKHGANCFVTPCPFCHINLDNYQNLAEKQVEKKIEMPVFHLSQLVGLALGLTPQDIGLSRHLVSPSRILR
ncbi:MAG: CoB--CoM heterodisulfide reductase iron-sulfur subunit B family protein [Deltaproteobacteria bacterium]|nr:CoB--CoM heterodisulfide reductase iron-sulfur subunit B family protein [Deltaproteobacteria bacterium]